MCEVDASAPDERTLRFTVRTECMCLRRPHVAKICSVEGWVVFIIKVRCVLNLALRETPLEVLNMASVNVLGVSGELRALMIRRIREIQM